MEKNFCIHKEMLRDIVDAGFWEILHIRKYFLHEIINSPFIDYTLDNMGDSNDLSKEITETKGDFVTPDIGRKVSLYYMAEKELLRDVRYYLCKEYNITYSTELEERKQKAKRNSKKEG